MQPRLQLFSVFRSHTSRCRPSFKTHQCSFATTTPTANKARKAQRRSHNDPYAVSQARARKAANISLQATLKTKRAASLGDPVRGITTPFLQSFDTVTPLPEDIIENTEALQSTVKHIPERASPQLNHFVTADEANASIQKSAKLTQPRHFPDEIQDPASRDAADAAHLAADSTAKEALARILALANGSGRDRYRANVQRCIGVFGRHVTDTHLAPRPASIMAARNPVLQPGVDYKIPRAGPDTGSSEVQIAILTAKIRALADGLQARGKHDAVNRRNLRLLVHRRQKLLKYLRRKERGGERWLHCIEKLGLTEGTWKGEISM